MRTIYSYENFQKLLMAIWEIEALKEFCLENSRFKPVFKDISQIEHYEQAIKIFLSYVEKNSLYDMLLGKIKDSNEEAYEEYYPYSSDKIFWTYGGAVNHKFPVYIERDADELALRVLGAQDYLTITAPRQMGKTSLVQKLKKLMQNKKNGYGYATVYLDLMEFKSSGKEDTTWEIWLPAVCSRIKDEIGKTVNRELNIEIPSKSWELSKFFADLVDASRAPGVVILIDEAASIPEDIMYSFYGTLRTMYIKRPIEKIYQKCNFVFSGMFLPERLVNHDNSPFNISTHIKLSDFSSSEIRKLLDNLSFFYPINMSDQFIDDIKGYTGGQPFLIQLVGAIIERHLNNDPQIKFDKPFLLNIMNELTEVGERHIRYIVKKSTEETLREPMAKIINGKAITSEAANQLELLGAIKEITTNKFEIGNILYKTAIRNAYTEEELKSFSSSSKKNMFETKPKKDKSIKIYGDVYGSVGNDMEISSQRVAGRDLINEANPKSITEAFEKMYSMIEKKQLNNETARNIRDSLDFLKEENDKGEKANEKIVNMGLMSLAAMADDIFEVAINTFVSPISGISTVVKKIAEKAKEQLNTTSKSEK